MAAAARGWITPEDVWTIACRWAASEAPNTVPAKEMFARVLDTDKVATLSVERTTADTMTSDPDDLPAGPHSMPVMPGRVIGPRYTREHVLGAGGVGEVVAALDREVRRVVALKTLQRHRLTDGVSLPRFVEEARITAQLEHPNIIPIYDVGADADGQPFYTMRIVKQRTLRDVLDVPELRAVWSLARMVNVFLQVTRALAYAHSRSVVHRDVKPENILLGDFGEVYLADWGIALVKERTSLQIHGEGSGPPPGASDVAGTIGYMAPETLRMEGGEPEPAVDVFALGVVLYEILTGAHPFMAELSAETMLATVSKDPDRPRDVVPGTPLLLEDLCMQMLAKEPDLRPSSCDEVARRIEEFLEGAKERERRQQEALKLCTHATDVVRTYERLDADRRRLEQEARELLEPLNGFDSVDKKRPGWQRLEAAARGQKDAALVLAEAIELYTKALGYDAESDEAHSGLADLYWSRAREAEVGRGAAEQVYYEALVMEHDRGKYGALLQAHARLSLRSNPPGAHVIAQRYLERDRVLVPSEERYLGRTPIRDVPLEPGSYLLIVKSAGCRDARYPILLGRGGQHDGEVNLYTEEEIGPGFVYIPGGVALFGGDEEAYNSLPRQEHVVADFAIAQFPVTFREYCAFLDDLYAEDPAIARRRAPADLRGSEGMVVVRGERGHRPYAQLVEGAAREMFPEERDGEIPVCLIDWFDARAYCRYLAKRTGANIRLATELEWEKAARGVDGRAYPWGDNFDPTFCKMRDSRPFTHQPEPVGTFATDESPYGVRDMAGGMREWVGDIMNQKSATALDAEQEPVDGTERQDSSWREIRSGNWNQDHKWARAASRGGWYALSRGSGLGFRLAKTLRGRRVSQRPGG